MLNSREFCFWLKGVLEFSGSKPLSKEQVDLIKDNLNKIFVHELPAATLRSDFSQIGKLFVEADRKAQNAFVTINPFNALDVKFNC